MPRNITRLNRDIRVIGDIRERTPYRKTVSFCSVGELNKRLNCKSMEIRCTIYIKYMVKVDGDADNDL